MKVWPIVLVIIVCIVAIFYNPATKTLSGEVLSVEGNRFTLDCTKERQSRFKPSDDIGYSCTIVITDQTSIRHKQQRVNIEHIQPGKLVSVELKNPVKLSLETPELEASYITIIEP